MFLQKITLTTNYLWIHQKPQPFLQQKPFSVRSSVVSLMTNLIFHASLSRLLKRGNERKLHKEDTLFVGVAWIVKPAFHLFKLCPEVVWVDVTSHSNNKSFHLLTFSSCLSIGKQIVWLWIFIPNQQRFSFSWVFQKAIPALVPSYSWMNSGYVEYEDEYEISKFLLEKS